jgi:feruloyl esterase
MKAQGTNRRRITTVLAGGTILGLALGGIPQTISSAGSAETDADAKFAQSCTASAVQALLGGLETRATAGRITNNPGPFFADGTRFTPAQGGLPAFCQVTGSYLTNPATGKTANFLATFPQNWNGKYLQLGCAGHCGTFAVSNPAMFTITITNQGLPGDIIKKGYAAFATDQGHTVMTGGTWAIKGPGQVDDEAITDFFWRASKVLTRFGKQFTSAFYAREPGAPAPIARSYFNGCSGGGRDALVAASYFPEEFDGIIAGSPYVSDGRLFHLAGTTLATLRTPDAGISRPLLGLFNRTVMAQCDAVDGVKDGLIQNPAACNFRPERDLPLCKGGEAAGQCFSKAQIETLSVVLTAVTDERGRLVGPGYAVSELQDAFAPNVPPTDPGAEDPWPEARGQQGGLWALANAGIKVFAYRNDPAFSTRSLISFRAGGPGPIRDFRAIVPSAAVSHVAAAWRPGAGRFPENYGRLITQNRKLLIWHNLSDEKLPPFTSVNLYKQLAARNGGYKRLQDNVRLFGLPGTPHCSGGGQPVGPGSFDAISAMENWVEKGQAPNALTATLYQPTPISADYSKPLGRTMPLCAFPAMARYKGSGDIKDGANWTCPADDTRMLRIGESGRRAGVLK